MRRPRAATPIGAPGLIGGPYRPPRGKPPRKRQLVECLIRGQVAAWGVSDAPIPWPLGRTYPTARPLPIVTAELARAIRTESVEAMAHWWGVSRWTVRRWRHALGVDRFNEGTKARWKELAPSKLTPEVRARALDSYMRGVRRRRRAAAAMR